MATFKGTQSAKQVDKSRLPPVVTFEDIATKEVFTREFGQSGSAKREDYNPALQGRAELDRFVTTYPSSRNPRLRCYTVSMWWRHGEGFTVLVHDKHSMRRVFQTREAADRVYNAINDWTTKTTLRNRGFSEW